MTTEDFATLRAELAARVAAEEADPEGTKRRAIAAARLEYPNMTDEQLEANWEAAQYIFDGRRPE